MAPFVARHPLVIASYMLASTVIALTQGLGMSFISTNLTQIAGPLQATNMEATWLMAAYLAPNVSLSLLLFKARAQFGIRNFAEVSIVVYVLVSLTHLWVSDYETALVVRFFAGAAAAPMSSLAFLYMLECVPPQRKLNVGLCLALMALGLSTPVAGLLSPGLLELGGWHALYVFEMGLAMVSLGLIYWLPLASPPRAKVIGVLDIVSYLLVAVGLGAFAVAFTTGKLYWWGEAPWLGVLFAVGIVAITAMAVIELNRENPLLDVRWLTSREIIHFTGALLVFRIILSEQSSGTVSFLRQMGLANEQMAGIYWVMLGSAVVSGLFCAAIMKPGREPLIHAAALVLLIIGSYLDSSVTVLTRPEQMYVSQMLIGFAGGLYLPPALAVGLMSALKRGTNYILSFIIVFLTTQKVGGILGSAVFGSFVTRREQFHSNAIVHHLTTTDPIVGLRLSQLAGAYGRVLADPVLRSAEGAALLSRQATQQAYALAYSDAFLATAVLAAFALGCLIVDETIERVFKTPAAVPATA
ncbi:MFS transporter [Amorphus sp. MBR-141]